MKKVSSFFIFMLTFHSILFAQTEGIVRGDVLVMLQDEKDIPSITRELGHFNRLRTNFQLKEVVSKSMHIYLFTFDYLHINFVGEHAAYKNSNFLRKQEKKILFDKLPDN